ncbi:PTS lactose/cellobiose transporter subunit IIA [Streptomyces sp. NPDC048659]|uniref:PTS lactose/cellobiose transporter subunit IIA n=1 Tax=Streptomyces sp. NPDC048659 TaxID=3155489 RepID=UPI00341828DD
MDERLAQTSMQILLHAGDARTLIGQALTAVEDDRFDTARRLLAQAKAEIGRGHHVQTGIVQGEARDEQQVYSVLFTHAQDTLMTVMSEHLTAERLIGLFQRLSARLDALTSGPAPCPAPAVAPVSASASASTSTSARTPAAAASAIPQITEVSA